MGSVTVYDAVRMKQIEDNTVTDVEVDPSQHLLITKHDGTIIDAGDISAVAKLTIADTESVDLTLGGSGTLASPWVLSANLKALPTGSIVTGLLEASYRGGGNAKVKIDGVLSSEAYAWMTPYDPWGSRQVRIMKFGTTWLIAGQTMDGYYTIDVNKTYWSTYADITGTATYSYNPRAVKLPSGLVVLTGLLRSLGTPPDGSVIFTLPPGMRPDHNALWSVEYGDQPRAILIKANGDVAVYGGWAANTYLSIDSIAFWSAGVPQWTQIGTNGSSFGTNFGREPGWDDYGYPSYWKDPYGFVWFRGLVKVITATSTNNQLMVNLPTEFRSHKEQHFRTTSNTQYGGIGGRPDGGLHWKQNSPGYVGAHFSLDPIVLDTVESNANNAWFQTGQLQNGWVNHSPGLPYASYLMREDGLRITRGLISQGSFGGSIMELASKEFWPNNGRLLFATIANDNRGRLDLFGTGDGNSAGQLHATSGTAGSWLSLDGRMWVP